MVPTREDPNPAPEESIQKGSTGSSASEGTPVGLTGSPSVDLFSDARNGIGVLLLNPDIADDSLSSLEGMIVEVEGETLRVRIDRNLRGMRERDGSIRVGFVLSADLVRQTLDPLEPFRRSQRVLDSWRHGHGVGDE